MDKYNTLFFIMIFIRFETFFIKIYFLAMEVDDTVFLTSQR